MTQFLFFWGAQGQYGYLSNFHQCSFRVGDREYNCSEQFFMKAKQEMFDPTNQKLADAIMNETDPKKIKEHGRDVRFYDEKVWSRERYRVMVEALRHKFSDPVLKQKLADTKPKYLVEASPYDRVWGVGMRADEAARVGESGWRGSNLLGKALMEVRDK